MARFKTHQKIVAISLLLCAGPIAANDWSFFIKGVEDYGGNSQDAQEPKSQPQSTRPGPAKSTSPTPAPQQQVTTSPRFPHSSEMAVPPLRMNTDLPPRPNAPRNPAQIHRYQQLLNEVAPDAIAEVRAFTRARLAKSEARLREAKEEREREKAASESESWKPSSTSRMVARSRTFYWGAKEPGYEYTDYEFVYDVKDAEQIEAYGEAILKFARNGWTMGLNRVTQEVKNTVDGESAVTRHEIRFKRQVR